MPRFIKGKLLCKGFFEEVVRPLLKEYYPTLKFSAGLLGAGSDVLGFDTSRSTDHDWGPRLLLFVSEQDYKKKKALETFFSKQLPYTYKGFTTNFKDTQKEGIQTPEYKNTGLIRHRIKIYTIKKFFQEYLGFDINKELTAKDWLVFSEQKLLTIRKGTIFYDALGLKKEVKRLHYYPKDVWRYLLASQWMKISEIETFVGRCSEVGDELGSRLVATRLTKNLMQLSFLLEKQYTPYTKWFGTGFSQLNISKQLTPILNNIITAQTFKKREEAIVQAYKMLVKEHNKQKITKAFSPEAKPFFERPYLVIFAEHIAQETQKTIKDKNLRTMNLHGSINQFLESADLLAQHTQTFKKLYK